MERFGIGDRIRIINKDNGERAVCIILDILEDYGGNTYWVKYNDGRLGLEYETPETIFIRYDAEINEIQFKLAHKIEKGQPQLH